LMERTNVGLRTSNTIVDMALLSLPAAIA
jgi:hypothetical protein